MNILFKNIPIGITAYKLANLIESIFNESGTGKIEWHISASSIEIFETQDNFTHPIERFGLVRIPSVEIAKKVIQELDGCVINQYQITVREYFSRSTENDPRLKKDDSSAVFLEKRSKDRRLKSKLLNVRGENRRAGERRIKDRRLEERIEKHRRIKERRGKDRREHHLIYARRV